MMNLTFDGKSLLISNEVAELVVKFAAALARSGGADSVQLAAGILPRSAFVIYSSLLVHPQYCDDHLKPPNLAWPLTRC
ncbi:hypothetical protein GY21_15510 [Cryobacterium roopkundense]|uniref:Uncharacterized protein n=1 Tax=Cryobacterium roopkundense TaxID=1001240 RepID=A0A099J4M1_9MICO|nr:hypothetical protein GY21_15510 [Cryobacterium roopkundense]